MKIVKPLDSLSSIEDDRFIVFLGGGMRKPWRNTLIKKLEKLKLEKLIIIDPSVDDYDPADTKKFPKQTDWEHEGLEKSDIEVFHFDDSSESPISLVELALYKSPNTLIHIEKGYKRDYYVEYLAKRFDLHMVDNLDQLSVIINIKYQLKT